MERIKQNHLEKSPTDTISCITSNGAKYCRWGLGYSNKFTVDSSDLNTKDKRCIIPISKANSETYIAGIYRGNEVALVTKDNKALEVKNISKWIDKGVIKTKV